MGLHSRSILLGKESTGKCMRRRGNSERGDAVLRQYWLMISHSFSDMGRIYKTLPPFSTIQNCYCNFFYNCGKFEETFLHKFNTIFDKLEFQNLSTTHSSDYKNQTEVPAYTDKKDCGQKRILVSLPTVSKRTLPM